MKKLIILLVLGLFFSTTSLFAQIRPAESNEDTKKEEKVKVKPKKTKPAPTSYKVKYQGGLFGFSKKQNGTIKFDDINERLVFFGKDGKEKFSIPYKAMQVIYPSQKKVQAGSGRAVGAVPVPGSGILGSLIKKRKNYMIIRFDDPDVDAEGTVNFLLDTEELLASAINSLGQKAKMRQRGDAYIRKQNEF